jgi:hypothetical protein
MMAAVISGLLFSARAQEANEIPQLHPFHAELPPTFWEQHGGLVLVTGLVLAALAGVLVWWWLRPRPPVVVPPEVEAREALAALPAAAAGATLSRVSRILREYLRRAFLLPPDECTTPEFCRLLLNHPEVGPELAGALADFFRDNDLQKFSPAGSTPPPAQAAARALALIEQCETRRASPRAAQTAASRPATQPA